jgi:hypothetical protein
VKKRVGEDACPFNALYWDFLDRNEKKLRGNRRLWQPYATWDRFGDDTKAEVRAQAKRFLDSLEPAAPGWAKAVRVALTNRPAEPSGNDRRKSWRLAAGTQVFRRSFTAEQSPPHFILVQPELSRLVAMAFMLRAADSAPSRHCRVAQSAVRRGSDRCGA